MEETLSKLNEEKENLIRETTLCEERLRRASILTSGLADEEVEKAIIRLAGLRGGSRFYKRTRITEVQGKRKPVR